jgi:hypothetical protein
MSLADLYYLSEGMRADSYRRIERKKKIANQGIRKFIRQKPRACKKELLERIRLLQKAIKRYPLKKFPNSVFVHATRIMKILDVLGE